jgi:hypothetical protein
MHPRLIVAGRLLLLFAAAGGAVTAWLRAAREAPASVEGSDYVCPMHPEVTSRSPSVCPVCRMALEPARPAAPEPPPPEAFDRVRRRSFGQDVVAPARLDDDGVVVASLYPDELSVLSPRESAVFLESTAPDAPRVTVEGTSDPPAPWDRSTARVRFTIAAHAPHLAPGTSGWVRIAGARRDLLVMPSSAVLEGVDGPYVLVASTDGKTLTRHSVELGRVVGGLAYVISGVAAQERVLVRNTFFVDAERRLHPEAAAVALP